MSIPQVVLWVIVTYATYLMYRSEAERMNRLDKPRDTATKAGVKVNTRSTQQPIPIVYGRRRVGGNDVFGYTGGNENRWVWLVQTLSEGECDSIYQSDGVDQIWLGDKLWNHEDYGDNVSYYFHSGSGNQTVNVDLNAVDEKWTDPMENTCYIIIRLYYDKDYFRGIPTRQIELKGKKVYDFRTDTTAWSDNPVLCLYDFFTNTRYGMGYSASSIDIDSWTTVANYCDTKCWGLNYVVNLDQDAWSTVEEILDHFRGVLNWWDGKFYLRYADLNDEASVMTIEDKHIYQTPDGKATIKIQQPGRFNKPDGLRVKFVDKDRKLPQRVC